MTTIPLSPSNVKKEWFTSTPQPHYPEECQGPDMNMKTQPHSKVPNNVLSSSSFVPTQDPPKGRSLLSVMMSRSLTEPDLTFRT